MKDSTLGILILGGLGAAFLWSRQKASANPTPTGTGGGLTAGGVAGGWVDQMLGKWGLGGVASRPPTQSLLPNMQTSGAGNNSNQAGQIGSAIGSAASGVSSLLNSISGLLSKKSSSGGGGGGGITLPNLGSTGGGVSTTSGGVTMPNVISGVDWPSSYDVFGGSGAGSGDIYAGGSDVYGYA